MLAQRYNNKRSQLVCKEITPLYEKYKLQTDAQLKILDVGCGDNPQGDVNCDIHTYRNPEMLLSKPDYFVDIKKIPNFVQCDVYDRKA